jgi:hypothetical protein
MSATKVWSTGDVLTASDLNSNFVKLPYACAAFRYTQVATVAPDTTATAVAVAFPAGRFDVAPIVTVSTSSPVLTAFVSAITAGTATINVRNNGNASSAASAIVTGFAVQMINGTAAG